MTVIAMSRREIDRMHVLRDMAAERISASEVAQLLRLTRRQIFRLAKAYRERGPAALVSARRGGKSSNRCYPAALRTEVLALIKANYSDFGPTLAREKLAERHGIHLVLPRENAGPMIRRSATRGTLCGT
jgi:winged helix-turn helix protein